MTTKASYPRIDSTSKAEEIKAIEAFAASLGPNTYLAGLFNSGMLDWVRGQINNDFPCDLYFEMLSERKFKHEAQDETRKMAETADLYAQELKDARDWNKKLVEGDKAARERSRELTSMVSEKCTRLDEMYLENGNLEAKLCALEELHRRTVAEKDEEIIRLKAKLYDAMTA